MSDSMHVDSADDVGDSSIDVRIHDLMDRLEDLGFSLSLIDQLEDHLNDATPLSQNTPLANIFKQLLGDLAAYGHGVVLDGSVLTGGALTDTLIGTLAAEGCPHRTITEETIETTEGRILALDFMLGEVQAAKMIALAKHKQQTAANINSASTATAGSGKKRLGESTLAPESDIKRVKGNDSVAPMDVDSSSNDSAIVDPGQNADSQELSCELHLLAHTLQVVLSQAAVSKAAAPSPAELNGVTALRLLRSRLASWLGESPIHAQAAAMPPLFKTEEFTTKQMMVLSDVYRTFAADYSLRIRVMRKRLEVALQSFMSTHKAQQHWGGKGKSLESELTRLSSSKLSAFPPGSLVDEYELWSATPQVMHIARMTSREYALRSSIKRVIIGKVPDRGGRVDTNTRIENEWGMPQFTKRSTSGDAPAGGGGGHRRGGGGGGGGRGRGRGR